MFFEGFAHHRDDAIVDETADGFLDHGLFFAQLGADVEQVERIECGFAHCGYSWIRTEGHRF